MFVPGVWGPYFSAMVPNLYLNEGGQSSTGQLVSNKEVIKESYAYMYVCIIFNIRVSDMTVHPTKKFHCVYAL